VKKSHQNLDADVHQISRPVDAGIVNQDIERLRCRNGGAHSRKFGYIQGKRFRRVTTLPDGLRGSFNLGRGAGGERHVRARTRQSRRCRKANPAAGPGDERALALEPERGRF
jgi:hypothetical protein